VRLDHLLSKEHSSAVCIQRNTTAKPYGDECSSMALMGGTLTLMQV
jgi:hypothetical protein